MESENQNQDQNNTVCVYHSVMSNPLQSFGLQLARLLCPWDFSGKNTEMGCISSSRVSSQPRDRTRVPYIVGGFFTLLSHRRSPKVMLSFPGSSYGKDSTTQVQSLGQEDPLDMEMTTHSSVLSCRISWTEEPGSPLAFKESDPTE